MTGTPNNWKNGSQNQCEKEYLAIRFKVKGECLDENPRTARKVNL